MSEPKHTQGPWVEVVDHDGSRYIVGAGVRIAKLCGGTALSRIGVQPPAMRENMALLTAAPDLAKTLSDLLASVTAADPHLDRACKQMRKDVMKARAALRKAGVE